MIDLTKLHNMGPRYARDQPEGFVNRVKKVAIVGVRFMNLFFFP